MGGTQFFSFFLSPVRVNSILKGHGKSLVLHILSQYFTNADFAANLWSQLRAACNQFRWPKYAEENDLGGRPLFLDGADGKFCTQSSQGIQAMGVVAHKNRFEGILTAKRNWFTKY